MIQVAIAGAGVGGLLTAYRLQQAGISVQVIEPLSRIGGAVHSATKDGFLLELGPNSSLARPALTALIEELRLEATVASPTAKNRYLAIAGREGARLERVPRGPLDLVRTPLLSPFGKLRAVLEPLAPHRSDEDESVESFVTRRFGAQTAKRIAAPLLSGIWAAEPARLSARSSLERLWLLETQCKSLLLSGFKRTKGSPARPKLVTFLPGMSALTEALRSRLAPGTIVTGSLAGVTADAEGLSLYVEGVTEPLRTEKLILTMAADAAAKILAPLESTLADTLTTTPYAPLGLLHIAYRRSDVAHPLDGFGFLCAPECNLALLGTIFSSALFPGRAPEGWELFSCFVGGAVRPQYADVEQAEVQERAIRELSTLIGARGTPTVVQATYLPRAIPSYEIGHWKLQEQVEQFELRYPAISIMANWYRGISVPDRIEAAEAMARRILGELG